MKGRTGRLCCLYQAREVFDMDLPKPEVFYVRRTAPVRGNTYAVTAAVVP